MMLETYQLEKYRAAMGDSDEMGTNVQEAIKNYMSTRRLK